MEQRNDMTTEQQTVPKKEQQETQRPRVICSAILYDDRIKRKTYQNVYSGVVFCGPRHHDCEALLFEFYPCVMDDMENVIYGFVTSDNRFVNRKLAAEIAYEAGQIKEKLNKLFSTSLY